MKLLVCDWLVWWHICNVKFRVQQIQENQKKMNNIQSRMYFITEEIDFEDKRNFLCANLESDIFRTENYDPKV